MGAPRYWESCAALQTTTGAPARARPRSRACSRTPAMLPASRRCRRQPTHRSTPTPRCGSPGTPSTSRSPISCVTSGCRAGTCPPASSSSRACSSTRRRTSSIEPDGAALHGPSLGRAHQRLEGDGLGVRRAAAAGRRAAARRSSRRARCATSSAARCRSPRSGSWMPRQWPTTCASPPRPATTHACDRGLRPAGSRSSGARARRRCATRASGRRARRARPRHPPRRRPRRGPPTFDCARCSDSCASSSGSRRSGSSAATACKRPPPRLPNPTRRRWPTWPRRSASPTRQHLTREFRAVIGETPRRYALAARTRAAAP